MSLQCILRLIGTVLRYSHQTQDTVRRWSQSLSASIAIDRIRRCLKTAPYNGSGPLCVRDSYCAWYLPCRGIDQICEVLALIVDVADIFSVYEHTTSPLISFCVVEKFPLMRELCTDWKVVVMIIIIIIIIIVVVVS